MVSIDPSNEIIILAYADDLMILADSVSDLKRKIKILSEYCEENDLTVNVKKSKIVIFQKGGHKKNVSFVYNEKKIEIVRDYVFLGVQFSNSDTFINTTNRTIATAKIAMESVLNILKRAKSNAWETKNVVFDSMVRSILIYIAEVWGLRYLDDIEKIHSKFFKRVLALPISTPNYATRLEANRMRLSHVILKSVLNWIEKIMNMPEYRYPRLCCEKIFKLANQNPQINHKYNWALQIESMIKDLKIAKNENCLDVNFLVSKKKNILEEFEFQLRELDWERLQKSTSLQIYPYITTKEQKHYYLNLGLSLSTIQIVAQIRLILLCCVL